MDVIRRNTDYALRLAGVLAGHYNGSPVSARRLAEECSVPYHLTCKLLQKLAGASIVHSVMGPAGGYMLSREPESISMRDVIECIQGRISLNSCLADSSDVESAGSTGCRFIKHCPLHDRLAVLQKDMDTYFDETTVGQLSINGELCSINNNQYER